MFAIHWAMSERPLYMKYLEEELRGLAALGTDTTTLRAHGEWWRGGGLGRRDQARAPASGAEPARLFLKASYGARRGKPVKGRGNAGERSECTP
jgi:hypothetical protein